MSTQPTVRWVPEAISRWEKRLGRESDHTHIHPLPRLGVGGAIALFTLMFSWPVQGNFAFTITIKGIII